MKPYNERLAMIDGAIESAGGVIERIKDYRKTDTHINYTSKLGFFSVDAQWAFCGDTVCTHEEFEQRAKELGWINGYKWGVEYEANGEKPDLPADVSIEIECTRGCRDLGSRLVKYNDWARTKSFRIVDERYRPKAVIEFTADSIKIQTPSGEYKDVIDLTNGEFNKMNNDWYENGELPPVGEVVEVMPTWDKVVIVAHHEGKIVFFNERLNEYNFFCNSNKFRPLRSEADKLVEQAMSLFSETESTTDAQEGIEHAVRKLIEQGYRKIKPMSEQEFMDRCVDICGHGSTQLYRAGCRFLDQGE